MTGEDHILMLFANMYVEHCAVMQFTTRNGIATVLMDVDKNHQYIHCADGLKKRGQHLGHRLKAVMEHIAGHEVDVKFRLVESLLPRDEYVKQINLPPHLMSKFIQYLNAADVA